MRSAARGTPSGGGPPPSHAVAGGSGRATVPARRGPRAMSSADLPRHPPPPGPPLPLPRPLDLAPRPPRALLACAVQLQQLPLHGPLQLDDEPLDRLAGVCRAHAPLPPLARLLPRRLQRL